MQRESCAFHEKEYQLKVPEKLRKILVVGGGPGGLYTAALAAKQGHDVTLWEKEFQLGGLANAAAVLTSSLTFGAILII